MNPILYHCVTGQAFFSGCALGVLGVGLGSLAHRRPWGAVGRASLVGAAGLVALSATPLPLLAYVGWAAAVAAWLASRRFLATHRHNVTRSLAVLAGAWPLALAAIEFPHHLPPDLPAGTYQTVYVIGDSVSAGLGTEDEVAWPAVFQEQWPRVRLVDLSRAGATVYTASRWPADQVQAEPAIVCLEIGGNDLLSTRDAHQIEKDLDDLLRKVSGAHHLVVMLELPLPPFKNGYGRILRRFARKHGVLLVPRRYFARVLAPAENTVDGIHLTNAGHRAMAALWTDVLSPALAN
jgi:acyl-CoA thioesterase-1